MMVRLPVKPSVAEGNPDSDPTNWSLQYLGTSDLETSERWLGMKRPLTLIVGTAAGAILIAGIGVSAHSGGFTLFRTVDMQQSRLGDEASGARLGSPEPSESPEASPTAEPTEQPEAPATAEPTEKPEAPDSDTETRPSPTAGSGDHDGDSHSGSGSGHDG